MNKITFVVPSINCSHCIHTIETELSEMDGVTSVAASSETNQVDVEFGDPANEEALLVLLNEINYPASV
jgi:copper chaperone CopZ